jgi:sugar lactone lactonase YvrE
VFATQPERAPLNPTLRYPDVSGRASFLGEIESAQSLRGKLVRLFRLLGVVAAVGAASLVGVGLKFPALRVRAQNAPAPAPASSAVSSRNIAATIVASSISSRSLAVAPANPQAAEATSTAVSEPSVLYLNSNVHSDQIFSFASAPASSTAKSFAAIVPEGVPAFVGANIPSNITQLALTAGSGPSGFSGDGAKATSAEFNFTVDSLSLRSGIVVAPDGTIYIADTANSTVRSIAAPSSSEPGIVRSVAGRFAPSQNVQLSEPLGLALDRNGNLYIADHTADAIDILYGSSSPKAGQLATVASVKAPSSIAVTPDGRTIFVASADLGTVEAINTQTRAIRNAGIIPASLFPASLASSAAVRVVPQGLAADGAGNLFVSYALTNSATAASAASNSDRILRLDAFTAKVTLAARGLAEPGEIAFDTYGNLFVSNQNANQILKFAAMGVPDADVTLTAPPPPQGAPPTPYTDFGDVPVGGSTDPTALQSFELANNSTADLTNVTASIAGGNNSDFTIANTSCISTLPVGQSCNFNVSFTPTQNQTTTCSAPTSSQQRCANLSVTYNGATVPLTSALAGTATNYDIECVSTSSVVCVPPSSGGGIQITVPVGYAATFPMQIVPDSLFNGPVTVVCPTSLPASPTGTTAQPTVCGISAGTTPTLPLVSTLVIDVTAGTPAPFNVTFQTTNSKGEQCSSKGCVKVDNPVTNTLLFPGGGSGPFDSLHREFPVSVATSAISFRSVALAAAVAILLFAGCAVVLAQLRTNPRRPLGPALALAAVIVIAASVIGCHHNGNAAIASTPVGTYNLTVTGTAQNASRGYTVTLIVASQ